MEILPSQESVSVEFSQKDEVFTITQKQWTGDDPMVVVIAKANIPRFIQALEELMGWKAPDGR